MKYIWSRTWSKAQAWCEQREQCRQENGKLAP